MKRAVHIIVSIIVGLIVVSATSADQGSMDHFLGEYQGIFVEDPSGTWSPADLDISIRLHDSGFVMQWKTVTKRDDGQVERQEYTVKFHPAKQLNIYAAAMRPDLFGGWIPLDPFNGDPFMWARSLNSTLTVYAMTITDTGAHDMQIYERSLIPDGLSIQYKRARDEKPVQIVTGVLKQVK